MTRLREELASSTALVPAFRAPSIWKAANSLSTVTYTPATSVYSPKRSWVALSGLYWGEEVSARLSSRSVTPLYLVRASVALASRALPFSVRTSGVIFS